MQENVGDTDRWLRVAVGGALVLGAASSLGGRRALGPGLLLAGGALLLETAITRVCPLNAALGVDSRGWAPFERFGKEVEQEKGEEVNGGEEGSRRELGRVRDASGGAEAIQRAQPEVAT